MAVPRPRHGGQKSGLPEERSGQRHLAFHGASGECLTDHRAGIAVGACCAGVLLQHRNEPVALVGECVFQEVLHHVVAVRMPGQSHGVGHKTLHELPNLLRRTVLHEPLQYAATVAMPGRLRWTSRGTCPAAHKLIDDELRGLWPRGHDALLDNMVGMWATYCLPYMALQLRENGRTHLIGVRRFQCPLHLAAATRIACKVPDTPSDTCA
mmetsp:Transcript_110357/g.356209  ORF Transcript_110357/g.356209 Transcript_110357/m.356209 type:complete len:210 (+) Transcript_110357:301-930(+)